MPLQLILILSEFIFLSRLFQPNAPKPEKQPASADHTKLKRKTILMNDEVGCMSMFVFCMWDTHYEVRVKRKEDAGLYGSILFLIFKYHSIYIN